MNWVGATHPESAVEVWCQDEARLGLIPVLRRVWSPVGERPVAMVERKYEWVYVYGFLHPGSGRVIWFLLPRMNAVVMGIALEKFAEEAGASSSRQLVVMLDGAPSHTAPKLVIPDHVHLVFQPAYSPELQPAERLWPLVREALANRSFESIEELETVLIERCRQLDKQPVIVQAATLYHWWPNDIAA